MSVALTVTVTTARAAGSWSLTGATATTAYEVLITDADGSVTRIDITSDGAGAGSGVYTPMADGAVSALVRVRGAQPSLATATATTGRFN